jgi:hypothetical protein
MSQEDPSNEVVGDVTNFKWALQKSRLDCVGLWTLKAMTFMYAKPFNLFTSCSVGFGSWRRLLTW